MASYKLSISIDQKWVKQFNDQNWQLCFAFGVNNGGGDNYNAVAMAQVIAANVVATWVDTYQIAGSSQSFSNGVTIVASTNPTDIKFGQSYTLPSDWTDGTVADDSKAPETGFDFINETNGAAAVVYKKVNGVPAPIYLSVNAPLPQGTEALTPIEKVAVWFQVSAQTGTMISSFTTPQYIVDMTHNTEASIAYDSTGIWVRT